VFSPLTNHHQTHLFSKTPFKNTCKNSETLARTKAHFFCKLRTKTRGVYLFFFNRFTTPESECSFIAATASPRTFFISAVTALSSILSQSPAVASKTSPKPICLAGRFSFAPPCGPFFCSISPALCSSRNVLRTITALSFNASAIADEVCIASGSLANTVNTRTLN
jgi:hypothetical protein